MKQIFIQTAAADLLGKAAQYKKDGYRMVQILCTRIPEGYELTYSFDKDYVMENLRVIVPLDGSVMSVTSQYWYAFVWENEIHDLFGLKVEFIAPEVDYGGKFFHLAKPMPWHELANAKQPAAAVKVNLRPGLGVDATVKPAAAATAPKSAEAAKPAAAAVKPAEAPKPGIGPETKPADKPAEGGK